MNYLRPLLALSLLATALSATAEAQTINRCESAAGGLVFTDQQCHLLGTAYRIDAAEPAVRRARPGARRVASGPRGFKFGVGCAARTPESLLGAVRTAIESGDVNQLTGLYDWNGAGRGHAMSVVRRMQRIVDRDLLTVEFDYADYEPALMPDATLTPANFSAGGIDTPRPANVALPDVVVAHYAWGHGGSSGGERFSMRRDAGCIWLAG